jgi:hypothetical protein
MSLLARVYGVFTIKSSLFEPLDVMIMQNTVKLNNKNNQKIVFDLKGSTVGRYKKLSEKNLSNLMKNSNCKEVLKDINFKELQGKKAIKI